MLRIAQTTTLKQTAGAPHRTPHCGICRQDILSTQSTLTHIGNVASDKSTDPPCLVSFHTDCMTPWIKLSASSRKACTCPQCRGLILPGASDSWDFEETGGFEGGVQLPRRAGHFPMTTHVLDDPSRTFSALEWNDDMEVPPDSRAHFVQEQLDEYLVSTEEEPFMLTSNQLYLQSEELALNQESLVVLWFWSEIVGCTQFRKMTLDSAPNDELFLPDLTDHDVHFVSNLDNLKDVVGQDRYTDLIANGTKNLQIPFTRTTMRKILDCIDILSESAWTSYVTFCHKVGFEHSRCFAALNVPGEGEQRHMIFVPWPEAEVSETDDLPRLLPGIAQTEGTSIPISFGGMTTLLNTLRADLHSDIDTLWGRGDFYDDTGVFEQRPDGSIARSQVRPEQESADDDGDGDDDDTGMAH